MSEKRQQIDDDNPDDKRRKLTFKSAISEVIKLQSIQDLANNLEPLIRRVVKEEIERALEKHFTPMKMNFEKEAHPSESRSLKLQFLDALSVPVYTGSHIEGEKGSSLSVGIIDDLTGQIVNSWPESSIKVEIVVLEGDFDGDEGENWTPEEFKNNIVKEREGKKPLLTGNTVLHVKNGIGLVGDISFTDNSSWTRSRKFRLGARVVDDLGGIIIREGKTESFIVKDHRGELYKKHYPPYFDDEVWRLEKIGKGGAFHKRLNRANINTLKDFLRLFHLDPRRLRNILGSGMSTKMWEAMIEHAQTCVLDEKLYLYHAPFSELKTGVIFNLVGQIKGVLLDGQYVTVNKLSETEKADALKLVISGVQHWEEVVQFDDEASLMGAICSTNSPRMDSERFLDNNKIGGSDYTQISVSSPDIISSIYSIEEVGGLENFPFEPIDDIGGRCEQPFSNPCQVTDSLICNSRSTAQDFPDEDHLEFLNPDLQCDVIDNFELRPASKGSGKAQSRWTKLFSVLQWFLIRKVVTRKTNERKYGLAL